MPAPTTVPQLLELIRKSKLIEPARLEAYLLTHPGPYSSPSELCTRLRGDGLLSPFHTEQLLKGKYKGFFLSRYKILDRIGLGGMGQVFLAEHTSMRRRVAIKVLPPERAANEFTRERFLREARAAAQLDHPNIVRAFDVDQDGEVIFLVMEFVDGVSFHDLVCRFGPLTPARAGYYLWQAANGLAYMHQNGLIHRDIKPANLLIDRQGVVKILDLGLVRAEGDNDDLTRGEGVKILGTADYLAPEQAIDCSGVDIRADIYSLGATAYFLLTGKPPFDGDRVAQKLIAHQTKLARPVHELRPEVPVELSAVIARMLAKKPDERFQSPAEIVAVLAEWARIPPPPPTEQEIPAIVGGTAASGSVNLSWNVTRPAPGSSTATNGSAIRYFSDQPQTSRAELDFPEPLLVPAPVTGNRSEKFCGTHTHPAVLPARTTHGKAELSPPVRLVTSEPHPAGRGPSRWRQRLSLALAFALTLVVAAWDVAVLTGAVERARPRTERTEHGPTLPGQSARR